MKLFYLTLFFLVLITSACQNNPESQLIEKHSNSLINETSPYLLQHAHNPVNWYPWSEEAFDLAKKQDKLVLISVGYSACHWCHVMERETFEDSTAAAFMNEHFISIKVDREERPDVDQVYMDAVQLMTKQGGWPLNCFALPDGKPIYGGTYFSKDAWMDVLINLVDLKANQPQKLENYAEELTKGIRSLDQLVNIEETENLDSEKWHQVVDDWKKYWDQKEGGPNRAPKFPLPNNFEFLLHYSHLINDDETETYVSTTLNKMIQGGIYDQIGGGFARYSTDAQWKAPHFEKMLYDNAQLLSLYALAYQKQANPEFKRIIEQTAEFINSELSHSSGAFYSALDADSDGEEGKFYVWTKPELKEAIGDDFSFLESIYEINKKGKWENDTYILLRKSTDQELAQKLEMSLQEYLHKLEQLNNALLSERNKRIRPGLDNKSITSWNALCVQGLTRSYRALENEKHLQRALSGAEFIWTEQQSQGKLHRTWKDGRSSINAYLEDYAFTIEAYIELYQATFDEKWLHRSRVLLNTAIADFSNEENGMFYFTSIQDSPLIARKLEVEDNVVPSGNSSLAKSLFLLGTLDNNEIWKARSKQMLRNVQTSIDYGQNYSNWGILGLWQTHPFYEVAITGDSCIQMRQEMDQHYLPNLVYLGGTTGTIPLLEGKFFDETTLFVCQNKTCQLPVNTSNEALSQIK